MPKPFEPKMSWDSDTDNILEEFYKPALAHSNRYDRLAGYFSSTSLMIAVVETLDFIERGGMMRLVTGAVFSPQDAKVLIDGAANRENILSRSIINELQNADDIIKKCAAILGWMLANVIDGVPQLEVKVAISKRGGIFHHKVGTFTLNDGRMITFSGSTNETAWAWMNNMEEFKAFKSWGDDTHKRAVCDDRMMFEKYWNNRGTNTAVYDIPEAVKNHLIQMRPKTAEDLNVLVGNVRDKLSTLGSRITLRGYQNDAISSWADNGFCGIFAMATGTGKTYTAFGCINRLRISEQRFATIIAVPQKHLVEQWVDSMRKWNASMPEPHRISDNIIMAYGDYPNWKVDLDTAISKFNRWIISSKKFLENDLTICTTHNTLSSDEFMNRVGKIDNVFLIADEVHDTGSQQRRNGLNPKYKYRLALSATPVRHYDEEGSEYIREYFRGTVYRFGIGEAIATGYLVPYMYYPLYVDLTHSEMAKYVDLTIRISRKHAMIEAGVFDKKKDKHYLEMQRAKIVSTAVNKYEKLKTILQSIGSVPEYTLVYCDENQINAVTNILSERNIPNDTITWKDPTSDRRRILQNLENRNYGCVTAIKCLDEGVDIPSARTAILMASTREPRQYIQRRGRVLRQSVSTGKQKAEIYDILVKSPSEYGDEQATRYGRKMVARELLRLGEFASAAWNRVEAYDAVSHIAESHGIDLGTLNDEYINSL